MKYTVTKKRGQSADFRYPRSNTDAAHTDYSHVSRSSYASDSDNTAHTIATKCVSLFTSCAQHNTHAWAHQQQHGSHLQLPTTLVLLCWIYQIYWMWLLISSLTSLIHPHSSSCSWCSASTQRKDSQLFSNNHHYTPKLFSCSSSSSAFLLTLRNLPTYLIA